ncbi:MAG: TniQ family protein [Actinomycetota bacterium]|nr:TniQ family protein [Actinomycetota bacterium]
MTVITPNSALWDQTFPVIREPEAGESLAGFMLRIDAVNGFDAGTTMRVTSKHHAGPSAMARPGDFLSGASFNLAQLALLAGGLPARRVEVLTVASLMRWLPRVTGTRAMGLGHVIRYQFCPRCARDHLLPLVFQFRAISGCDIHNVRLVSRCSCGSEISPFFQQTPFTCHEFGCEKPYADLPTSDLTRAAAEETRVWSEMYRDFFRCAAVSPLDLSGLQLSRACRVLLGSREGPTSKELLRHLTRSGPSFRVLGLVLRATESSVSDLIAAAAASSDGYQPASPRIAGRCPNPSCPSTRFWKYGRIRGEQAHVCTSCGTCFTKRSLLFSFDHVPGYANWRAIKNNERLVRTRERVRSGAAEMARRGRVPTRQAVFAVAGIPSFAPYATERAGLTRIIDEVRQQLQPGQTSLRAAARRRKGAS